MIELKMCKLFDCHDDKGREEGLEYSLGMLIINVTIQMDGSPWNGAGDGGGCGCCKEKKKETRLLDGIR